VGGGKGSALGAADPPAASTAAVAATSHILRRMAFLSAGQLVNGSSRWLKSHMFCAIPEHVMLSVEPGQPPLSRWIAQTDRKFMFCCWAKSSIVCVSAREVTSVFFG